MASAGGKKPPLRRECDAMRCFETAHFGGRRNGGKSIPAALLRNGKKAPLKQPLSHLR